MSEGKKTLDGDQDKTVRDILHVYNTWSRRAWEAGNAERESNEKLREFIQPESRKFKARVKAVLKTARPEWTLSDAELRIVIQHDHRPLEYYVSASVDLNFYDDWRRGELKLSASIDKIDLLLEELKRAVCGNGGAQ
jgi:hypothetical protein